MIYFGKAFSVAAVISSLAWAGTGQAQDLLESFRAPAGAGLGDCAKALLGDQVTFSGNAQENMLIFSSLDEETWGKMSQSASGWYKQVLGVSYDEFRENYRKLSQRFQFNYTHDESIFYVANQLSANARDAYVACVRAQANQENTLTGWIEEVGSEYAVVKFIWNDATGDDTKKEIKSTVVGGSIISGTEPESPVSGDAEFDIILQRAEVAKAMFTVVSVGGRSATIKVPRFFRITSSVDLKGLSSGDKVATGYCPYGGASTSTTCWQPDDGYVFDPATAGAVVTELLDYAGNPRPGTKLELDYTSPFDICVKASCDPQSNRGAYIKGVAKAEQFKWNFQEVTTD